MFRKVRLWLLGFGAVLVPALVFAVAEVVTRDTNQTPCPAFTAAASECRNLRMNDTTKGLLVSIAGGESGAAAVSVTQAVPSYSKTNIAANATTVIKSGAGTLHAIIVNNPGTAWTIQLCDNATNCASGSFGTIVAVVNVATYIYDVAFTAGLSIVTASGAPAGNVTVSYN